ncbi:transposase [Streptomyces sp. NPDC050485]|uniref:transposase n=1 Tax=Streptomyces sp. NPDC050485 TaxID=3365617 RepID=UPI003799A5D3
MTSSARQFPHADGSPAVQWPPRAVISSQRWSVNFCPHRLHTGRCASRSAARRRSSSASAGRPGGGRGRRPGQFEDHHARLLGVLLSTVDHLTGQIHELDRLIAQTLEEITTPPDGPDTGDGPATTVSARVLAERLDAVPGIGPTTAQINLAEIGADMSRFPTPEHLVSWAKLCPRTIQSGAKNTTGPAGQGNPWLKGALGEAANAAARTDTFLGARYRRIVKRRGHAKALVAVARSMLVIAWHLINDPDASYQELGVDWHRRHLDPARKTRDLVRQLQALGHQVTLTPTSA